MDEFSSVGQDKDVYYYIKESKRSYKRGKRVTRLVRRKLVRRTVQVGEMIRYETLDLAESMCSQFADPFIVASPPPFIETVAGYPLVLT